MKPTPGQSLTEYALPILLLVVASGVIFQATSFLPAMNSNIGQTANGVVQNNRLLISTMGTLPKGTVITPEDPFASVPGQQVSFTLADGKQYSLTMKNPEDLVVVSGGNGTTNNSLAMLDSLIAQMVANDPEGEDPRIPELKELSARGHRIADAQKLLQDNLPAEKFQRPDDRWDYLTSHFVTFEGKQISLLELGGSLNYYYGLNPSFVRYNSKPAFSVMPVWYTTYNSKIPKDTNNPINSFMSQMESLRKSNILKDDQTLSTLVNDVLSNQIFYSAENTFYAPTVEDVQQLVHDTRTDSGQLCKLSRFINCQAAKTSNDPPESQAASPSP